MKNKGTKAVASILSIIAAVLIVGLNATLITFVVQAGRDQDFTLLQKLLPCFSLNVALFGLLVIPWIVYAIQNMAEGFSGTGEDFKNAADDVVNDLKTEFDGLGRVAQAAKSGFDEAVNVFKNGDNGKPQSYCKYCGSAIYKGEKRCSACGASIKK